LEWTKRNVTVTGAAGFIGSHLTERLVAEGAIVTAFGHGFDRGAGYLRAACDANPAQVKVTPGDLRDRDAVFAAVEGADTVFHLGAVTSVKYSYAHPEETIAVNTVGTLNVCAAAKAAGVRRLVHTSTAGVYGNAIGDEPITESHPVSGCNPYTAGKLGGDRVAETYHLSYDLPVATIRLFNTYGPRMGRYLIMPEIVEQLLAGDRLLVGDLTPIRPFVYVSDIVDAFLLMGSHDAGVGTVIHFGGTESIDMGELVERIAALMNRTPAIETDPARLRPGKSEIYRVRVDAGKARAMLGWKPRVSLDEGLRATIDWIAGGGYARRDAV